MLHRGIIDVVGFVRQEPSLMIILLSPSVGRGHEMPVERM